ncbi:TBPL1 protein, partial [Polyodon spathula]|nr:TBPL1 protein [Polyodon spathula]
KVLMKLRKPKITASIWSSGKIICTGATSEEDSKLGAQRLPWCLQRLGFKERQGSKVTPRFLAEEEGESVVDSRGMEIERSEEGEDEEGKKRRSDLERLFEVMRGHPGGDSRQMGGDGGGGEPGQSSSRDSQVSERR